MRLAKKRCLVVGGTGGIGLASARRFLDEGASVVITGLPDVDPKAALEPLHLTDEAVSRVSVLLGDVTIPEQVEALFASAVERLGGLDVLFHLAGGTGRRRGDGSLHDCTDDGWRFSLDINLTSTFLTNRAAVRHFLANRQPGVILNTASVLAVSPAPRHFDAIGYTAAKGGVIAMSRLAAARYGPDGIRVNVLAPGLIDTPMTERVRGDATIQEYLKTKQPLAHGPGMPADVAEAAVYLCSDEARFVTGLVFQIDGGWGVTEGLRTED